LICDQLEDELYGQLNIPWSTAAHERVADTHVRRDGDRQESRAADMPRSFNYDEHGSWIGEDVAFE